MSLLSLPTQILTFLISRTDTVCPRNLVQFDIISTIDKFDILTIEIYTDTYFRVVMEVVSWMGTEL